MKLLRIEGLTGEALRLRMLQSGAGEQTKQGWIHEKTVPYCIIAEAVRGRYVLKCGGVSIETGPGEAWVTAPDTPLHITHTFDPSTDGSMYIRYVHFSFTIFDRIDVLQLLKMPMKLKQSDYKPVGEAIGELNRFNTPEAAADLIWQARRLELAFRILSSVCRAAEPEPQSALLLARTRRFKPLSDYLHANLAAQITASDMAKACHLSLSGFHRYFREYAGTTPLNHLKRIRLSEAARLLLSTDLSLAGIADRVGFTNPFHLSREFKREYRQSPSTYRQDTYGRMTGRK